MSLKTCGVVDFAGLSGCSFLSPDESCSCVAAKRKFVAAKNSSLQKCTFAAVKLCLKLKTYTLDPCSKNGRKFCSDVSAPPSSLLLSLLQRQTFAAAEEST